MLAILAVSAFSATLAPACHLNNAMFTRVATDWYAYYGTLYKMASEQPGVKDLFNSIARFASPTLVLKPHGSKRATSPPQPWPSTGKGLVLSSIPNDRKRREVLDVLNLSEHIMTRCQICRPV